MDYFEDILLPFTNITIEYMEYFGKIKPAKVIKSAQTIGYFYKL